MDKKVSLGVYEHYKGGAVKVIAIARHSETLEQYVVYESLYECRTGGKGSVWIRPLSMFTEEVVKANKQRVPRFTFVE